MVLPIFKQNYCFTLYRLSLFLGLKPLSCAFWDVKFTEQFFNI